MLEDRPTRSQTSTRGWQGVRHGLLLVGGGLALATWLNGVIARDVGPGRAMPAWILAVVGGLFALGGSWVTWQGARDLLWRSRMQGLRAAYPDEPWRWDHPWDHRAAFDDPLTRARYYLLGAVVLVVFLTPFHWLGFFATDRAPAFRVVALVFDAIAVGVIVGGGYFLGRRLKYGPGIARFERFPFRRGSELQLLVDAARALPQHASATATLRCVQEREVTTDGRRHETTTVECFEVFRAVAPAELVGAGAGRRAFRVSFAIPADAPSTDFASRLCRYWEVDVEAITDGIDYAARFLVPVY